MLNKMFANFPDYQAFIGFYHTLQTLAPAVATGNWGCGAYNGDKKLKSLLQLIVCCIAKRPMVYFTFYDTELCDDIEMIFRFLTKNHIKIGNFGINLNKSSFCITIFSLFLCFS